MAANSGADPVPADLLLPSYLANSLRCVTDVDGRRHLRSIDPQTLLVPHTRRRTFGDRAFPVAAAKVWNNLPSQLRYAPSLPLFRLELKTLFFQSSLH